MWLDVGKPHQQLLRPLDRKRLDGIGRRAALIIAAAGIPFGIFVREDGALRLQHRLADNVLGSDQFDLSLLAAKLVAKIASSTAGSLSLSPLTKKPWGTR